MKKIILGVFIIIGCIIGQIKAQVTIPYSNNFDTAGDTLGWSHYSVSGTDDWELGIPNDNYFSSAYTSPNAWATNLDQDYSAYSERVLESPLFNLTDTTTDYALSFFHKRHSASAGAYYYLEYSNNNGSTWQLLNDVGAQKKNWQVSSGFSGNVVSSFQHSAINLSFIQGQDSIRFRFRFVSNFANGEGWMIDDFRIEEEYFNIYGAQEDAISISQKCNEFEMNTTFGFYYQFSSSVFNTTNYYFSLDSTLDSLDTFLTSRSSNISGSLLNWNQSIDLPFNVSAGNYYIVYEHDALDTLMESIEVDNIGYAELKVDSVFEIPYVEDFEDSFEPWVPFVGSTCQDLVWELGNGYLHHLEDAHSGTKAWHINKLYDFDDAFNNPSPCGEHYINSNYFDLTTYSGNLALNLWYKNYFTGNSYSIEYNINCQDYWSHLYTVPFCRGDDWDFINVSLNSLAAHNNIRFRIKYLGDALGNGGIMFDDVYVGGVKADLSIEKDKLNRFTSTILNVDTLKYFINNSGLSATPPTSTNFYWSNDSIYDVSDLFLGTKQEQSFSDTARFWTSFTYTKPSTSIGQYYILYILDTANAVDEMRESNNTGYFTIYQENSVIAPYFNDLESEISGWRHNASLGQDDWQWTEPAGSLLDSAFSGTKVWVTNDTGLVSPMSRMHLYTPIFDLSTLANPVLEFDMKLHSHPACHCFEGKMNMSYSIDGGATWIVLDTTTQSYNRWYYPMEYVSGIDNNYYIPNYTEILFGLTERAFAAYTQYNGRDVRRNTKYILDIGFLNGARHVQFRFNLATLINNFESPNYPIEGALIDNFAIRESFVDLNVDEKKALMISSNALQLKFFMHIKNQGNYVSVPSITNYYVSADTLIDTNDYYLGQASVPSIRPDMYFYVNKAFNAPVDLSSFQFLLYELDELNTNSESNETNNIGYWPLALDSISEYPYFNDFNDTIVDGWHQYSIESESTTISNYRFRNIVAPGEAIYQTAIISGEWFTERVSSWVEEPYFYLESPVFDFGDMDSVFISFDLMCTGQASSNNRDGGNLHFSIDGGNTWAVLTSSMGQSYNWYNYEEMNNLDYEPGWSGPPAGYGIAVLDSTTFDASFLKGQNDVVFRFKYKSNWEYFGSGTTVGMRVDNFKVEGYTADYVANDSLFQVVPALLESDLNINYSITNSGQSNGRITKTNFYWSEDDILDENDSLILSVSQGAISSGATSNSSADITYPTPIAQLEYYLFYTTDSDFSVLETNELNNLGSYKIIFPSYPNYFAVDESETVNALISQETVTITYSVINDGGADGINTTTEFFWSMDSVFDIADQNIHAVIETPILSGDTLSSLTSISYPLPINQSIYHLFFVADINNDIIEINELDNIGDIEINFNLPNSISDFSNTASMNAYVNENYLFVLHPAGLNEQLITLRMIDVSGRTVYSLEFLNVGINKFILPSNISSGIYLIYLQKGDAVLTRKISIQH